VPNRLAKIKLNKALANENTLLLMMFLGAQTLGTQNECCVSMLRKLGNICCGHKMDTKMSGPDTKFVSTTKVARAGKWGNICVGNNVSAIIFPRLPGPLRPWQTGATE